MELIRLTRENIAREHICCALSGPEAQTKKAWLAQRLNEGLVFLKCNVRGKCFIEYIPAERAWAPVQADGYLYIDCLWVSGQFKGHGYSNLLLEECIRDGKEKGRKGLVALSSPKKLGFLVDKKFLEHKGFAVCDAAAPYFEMMYLPFEAGGDKPRFREQVKNPIRERKGLTLYYTDQCPFTAKYVPILAKLAAERGVPMEVVHFERAEAAQNGPCPFSVFSLFCDGDFVTHEILSEKKFDKLLAEHDW